MSIRRKYDRLSRYAVVYTGTKITLGYLYYEQYVRVKGTADRSEVLGVRAEYYDNVAKGVWTSEGECRSRAIDGLTINGVRYVAGDFTDESYPAWLEKAGIEIVRTI